MTRYAVLSDIHANLEALEAVLADAGKARVDEIWFLGDLVVYGPEPNECIVRLREAIGKDRWPGTAVIGNNDQAILIGKEPETITPEIVTRAMTESGQVSVTEMAYRDATTECHHWTAQALTPDSLTLLSAIPAGPRTVLNKGILVHASPCDPVGMNGNYLTNHMEAEDAFWCLQDMGHRICLFGHTHLTTLFRETRTDRPYQNCDMQQWQVLTGQRIPLDGSRLLINPGSVGQPRDGNEQAAYAILDDSDNTVEFRRIAYEREKTLLKLRATSMTSNTKEALQKRLKEAR